MSVGSVDDVVVVSGTVVVGGTVVVVDAAISAAGRALTNTYVNPINATMTIGSIHRPGFGSSLLTMLSLGRNSGERHHRAIQTRVNAMDLEGRTAVVTGGAVRVGAAITRELVRRGASVFIHYNRSAEPAEALRSEIADDGGVAAIGSVDLSRPDRASDLIAAAAASLGPPTILINSASGFPFDTIDDVTVEDFRAAQDLSLASPMMLIQAFGRLVPKDLDGAVVNITDVKTVQPYRKHLSYMLAKGGIDTLTRAAAIALAPGIRVNAVALGVILPPPGEGADYAEQLAAELPLARVGGAQVVADTVAFLCENDFITGEIIRLDGGAHLV